MGCGVVVDGDGGLGLVGGEFVDPVSLFPMFPPPDHHPSSSVSRRGPGGGSSCPCKKITTNHPSVHSLIREADEVGLIESAVVRCVVNWFPFRG